MRNMNEMNFYTTGGTFPVSPSGAGPTSAENCTTMEKRLL